MTEFTPTRAIVVLGMHRSGTSALAGMLNLAGATVPKTLIQASPDNPAGFWESRIIMEFNDRVLRDLGHSWSQPFLPREALEDLTNIDKWQAELREVLREEFGTSKLWVIKDPRICRLMPLWSACLDTMGIDVSYALIFRNPKEVAASLSRRNGLKAEVSYFLWLEHMLLAERDTRAEPRAFCSHEELLTDWKKVLSRIDQVAGMGLSASRPDVDREVGAFLDCGLRHHSEDDFYVVADERANMVVEQAYRLFREAMTGNAPQWSEADNIYEQFFGQQQVFAALAHEAYRELNESVESLKSASRDVEWLSAEVDGRRKQVMALEEERGGFQDELRRRQTQLDELEQSLREARAAADSAEREVTSLKEQIGSLEASAEDTLAALAETHQEKRAFQQEILALQRSLSWRIGRQATLGLRMIYRSSVGAWFLRNWRRLTGDQAGLSWDAQVAKVRATGLFDAEYYLEYYPSLRFMFLQPIEHFVRYGVIEGRNPNPYFDTRYYLSEYPEVERDGINPLVHYDEVGAAQGYNPSLRFDTSFYLVSNPDIGDVNPLRHFIEHGQREGRLAVLSESKNDVANLVSRIDSRLSFVTKTLFEVVKKTDPGDVWANALETLYFPHNDKPLASVVVPFHNKAEYTARCLLSLADQDCRDFELILVDDASTEGNVRDLSAVQAIRVIKNAANLGYLQSCNAAAAQARGRYIVMLNNDVAVFPDWLTELLAPFRNIDDLGLVGSMLLYPDGRLQEAGGVLLEDGSAWNYGRDDDPHRCEYNYVRDVDYCSGASLAIPSLLWNQLHGYADEYAPAYYEDADLAMRVRQAGYRVVCNPFSRLIHFEGISCGRDVASGVKRCQERNQKLFYRRWAGELPTGSHTDAGKLARRTRGGKRVLWLDATTLTPDQDAGSTYSLEIMKSMLDRGLGISFAPWGDFRHDGRYTESMQRVGIECLYSPYFDAVKTVAKFGREVDLIVLCRAPVAIDALPLVHRYAPQAKLVFNTIDLHYLRYQRESRLHEGAANGETYRSQPVSRDEELGIARVCDATIVVSEQEKKVVLDYEPSASVSVIPVFSDHIGRAGKYSDRRDICFIGGFAHPPNRDAVSFFVKEIWPRVADRIDGKFLIVGSKMPDSIREFENDKGIIARGYVEDLAGVLDSVKLTVAPLRYGAGIKGKLISSLAHGVPAVVTSAAAAGMLVEHGRDVIVADDPEEFAQRVVELYNDSDLWQKLSDAGLDRITEDYSRECVVRGVNTLLETLGFIVD